MIDTVRPQAYPCLDCGTRYGAPMSKTCLVPSRSRGLCNVCYKYHYNRGTLGKFTKVVHPQPAARPAAVPLRHPGERRDEQRQRIAARVAADLSRHGVALLPVVEGDDFDPQLTRHNFEDLGLAWQAAHPEQVAAFKDPDCAYFGAANATAEAA